VRLATQRRHRSRGLAVFSFIALTILAGGCAHRRPRRVPPPVPPPTTAPAPTPTPTPPTGPTGPLVFIEEGMASWYGVPFHGRRTSNGETYDMNQLTAAHRTLPFNTVVRVTNLANGRKVDVRINDRGPFVEGRIIDLSLAAARALDMVAAGVARVRLERVGGPQAPETGNFTVQVGAFLERANAVRLRQRLEQKYQPVFIVEYDSPKGLFYRVRVGRVSSEAAANRLAERLRREEGFTPFVVRLDE
jgi:rare lipoprotein A